MESGATRPCETKAGLSHAELAERSDISVRTIWAWEVGRRIPLADALSKLAEALGTDCDLCQVL